MKERKRITSILHASSPWQVLLEHPFHSAIGVRRPRAIDGTTISAAEYYVIYIHLKAMDTTAPPPLNFNFLFCCAKYTNRSIGCCLRLYYIIFIFMDGFLLFHFWRCGGGGNGGAEMFCGWLEKNKNKYKLQQKPEYSLLWRTIPQ